MPVVATLNFTGKDTIRKFGYSFLFAFHSKAVLSAVSAQYTNVTPSHRMTARAVLCSLARCNRAAKTKSLKAVVSFTYSDTKGPFIATQLNSNQRCHAPDCQEVT